MLITKGDHLFLIVTSTTGIGRALKSKKLNPKFIGPFQIFKRIGPVVYQIALPSNLSNLHNVFHVSQLRKYYFGPSHIIAYDTMQIRQDLTYETKSVQIIDISVKHLRGKQISLVKVVQKGLLHKEATWELEDEIKKSYLELLPTDQ